MELLLGSEDGKKLFQSIVKHWEIFLKLMKFSSPTPFRKWYGPSREETLYPGQREDGLCICNGNMEPAPPPLQESVN
ncbi:hypothetical protein R3398_21620 [Rossellomorea marisflavi]|uniref:hypothetical protein n=1 Tax=Rossellomorea marisflavi TaxID=189381 RepID=UPI00296F6297|nr:hypothetical protein [Rossellomorea marisflavi]MDW4528933.1 hypothetical protein [Rossellomorea marisflavi]